MVASLLTMAGLDWPVPDTSTLCRRQRTVTIQIPYRHSGGSLNLLVDSTGVKMLGEGEWQVRRHGPSRRRQWRKVHLAMEAATRDVRGVEFTSSREGDSPVLPGLPARIPSDQPVGTVTAVGAHDTRTCHSAIVERGATAIIPIRRNGRAWKEEVLPPEPGTRSCGRPSASAGPSGSAGQGLTPDVGSRRRCGASRPQAERIASPDPDRQTAEIHVRIALMNRFSALGQAKIVRVA